MPQPSRPGFALRALLAVFLLLAAAPGSPQERKPFAPGAPPRYMPERIYDLRHLRLDLAFDSTKGEISGTATNTLVPLRPGTDTLVFHAADLRVAKVRLAGSGEELRFSLDPQARTLTVRLGRAYGPEDVLDVAIDYSARPRSGLYFVGPDEGYPDKPRQIYSQGQPDFNHHWFPSWDYPNDRATTELLGTVERPFQVVSNGRLVEVTDRPDGRRTFHWKMEQPHTTYLVSVVVGELSRVADEWKGIPVEYYVPPGREDEARRSFGVTPKMMDFFSTVTGRPYPYAKYAQSAVYDYMWGGMENTTATTMTERTLHDARAALDISSEYLVAHELAHQWFGDLVTCRSWEHVWLNEGFADYMTALWFRHAHGMDEFAWELDDLRQDYLAEDRDEYRRPIATRRYADPVQMFDAHTYEKGALVLRMVHYLLGEETWWRAVREYLARFAGQTVTTEEVRGVFEQASGMPLGPLFDQYVHGAGHPELSVRWHWRPGRPGEGMVRLEVEQTQRVTDETGFFSFPVEIGLVGASGMEVRRVQLEPRRFQDLDLPSDERPRTVVFDPRAWMLAAVDFDKPLAEWIVQLEAADSLAAKLEALRALGEKGGGMARGEAEAALGRALREEPFRGARQVAAQSLAKLATDAALSELRAGLADREGRVRTEVLKALSAFPRHRELIPVLTRALEREEGTYARAAAAESLGSFEEWRGEAAPALVRALSQKSHNDAIAAAAIKALAALGAPQTFDQAVRYARYGAPGNSRDDAFLALARYAAKQEDPKVREEARRILEGYLDDPSYLARRGLYPALAELGDPAAIPALERAARNEVDAMQRLAAEKAIEELREPPAEAGTAAGMADRLQQLEREAEVLRQRIDELEGEGESEEKVEEEKGTQPPP